MSASLVLILAVVLAYLAAHVAFDWLARRFMLVSGAEYLLLGILLGPHVSGILSAEVMTGFTPLITLALGWIGTIVGTQFYLPSLVQIEGIRYRLASLEALGTMLVVGGTETVLLIQMLDMPVRSAVIPGVALGAIAAISAPAGIAMATQRLRATRREPIIQQLALATAIDALFAILGVGLLLCVFHSPDAPMPRQITATEWAVITIAVGVVGGALFHLFLGDETASDRLFLSLAGAIIVASGAAAYLQLSPVLTSMIVGAVLINTSRSREAIARTLADSERPFYFVLLVFAGASWGPSAMSEWWAPVLLFLVARVAGKVGTARLAARLNDQLGAVGPDWGRALVGQGGLAVAVAFDYARFQGAVLPSVVFTAAVASVLVTDVASARLIHSVVSSVLPRVASHRAWQRFSRPVSVIADDAPASGTPGDAPATPDMPAAREDR